MDYIITSNKAEYQPIAATHYADPKFDKTVSVDLSWKEKGISKPTKRMYKAGGDARRHDREITFSQWANMGLTG